MNTVKLTPAGPPDDQQLISPAAPPADFVSIDPATGLETVLVTGSRGIEWTHVLLIAAIAGGIWYLTRD